MGINLKRHSYEQLIRQLIFIDENKTDIINVLLNKKQFFSKSGVQKFLKDYVTAIESLLANINALNDNNLDLNDCLPYIIIGSDFTLIDTFNIKRFCHLSSDLYRKDFGITKNIYAFSETGLELLMKKKDEKCFLDFGNGISEFRVNSISLI
jgi:hypothetical protein